MLPFGDCGDALPQRHKLCANHPCVMGQQQSQESRLVLPELNAKNEAVRNEVLKTIEIGDMLREGYADEVDKLEMELYLKKLALHNRGEIAKNRYSFWEYVRIINVTLRKSPHPHEQKKTLLPPPTTPTPPTTSTALTTGWDITNFFNIFSWFEAMLLRRLYVAMLMKRQREVLSTTWNKVVVFLHDQIPIARESAKALEIKLKKTTIEASNQKIQLRNAFDKHIERQEEMIAILKDMATSTAILKDMAASKKASVEGDSAAQSTTGIRKVLPSEPNENEAGNENEEEKIQAKERAEEEELNGLLEKLQKGEDVDEDRLYELELFDRRRKGEVLTPDEMEDLEVLVKESTI